MPPLRRRFAPFAIVWTSLLAACASPGGGRPETTAIRTPSIVVAIDAATLGWRVEDPTAPPGQGLLLESRLALDIEPGGRIAAADPRSPVGPARAVDTTLGPARTRTFTLASGPDRPAIELTVTALERRRAVALSAEVHNTSSQPLTIRRFAYALPESALLARPALPREASEAGPGPGVGAAATSASAQAAAAPLRLFLLSAVSWIEPRLEAAVPGLVHSGSGVILACQPAARWTWLAGFPSPRMGYPTLSLRIEGPGSPSGPRPGDVAASPPAADRAAPLRLGAETEHAAHRLAPGERAAVDDLLLVWDTDPAAALDAYAAAAAGPSSKVQGPTSSVADAPPTLDPGPRPLTPVLSAWSSWYSAYRGVSEDGVLANVDFAARHLKDAGLDAILLEDGYQRAVGDWEPNARFPHGHRWLTDQIHAKGLKAGLWIAPCLVAEKTALFHDHPDWMARDAEGRPRADGEVGDWGGRFYVLDAIHPEASRWLTELMRRAVGDWGYDFVKADYLERATHGDRFYLPVGPVPAYTRALDALLAGCGTERLRLASALLPPSMGRVAAMRIGPDVGVEWSGLRRAALAIASRQFLHGRAWENDPDAVIVRPPLTDDEARTWATLMAMSGGTLVAGDLLPSLPPDRASLLQKAFPAALPAPRLGPARPLDLFDADRRRGPTLWPKDAAASPIASGAGGRGASGQSPQPVVLPAGWRFATGDDASRADPGFDDGAWAVVAVPGSWEDSGFPTHNGYGWYRVRFRLPPDWPAGDAVLDLGVVDDVDTTYVNGKPVGTTGRFPPDYETQFSTPRRYTVPDALLRRQDGSAARADNFIAVRVFDQGGPGGILSAGPALPPGTWHLPASFGGEPADLLLLINWTDAARRLEVAAARLHGGPAARRLVYDATEETLLGEAGETIGADVRPHASRLLVVRGPGDRPQVVGTSRHLLPGVFDLVGVAWDAEQRTLRGRSRSLIPSASRIPGTPEAAYTMTLHVPPSFRLARAAASQPCALVRQAPELLRVEFPEIAGDAVDWSLEFAAKQ